ncbi:hypothetical protein N7513_006916 [Penicillium frequentans]|nr:hypothetical protein N7513_006916 [Penicillium glabrum]
MGKEPATLLTDEDVASLFDNGNFFLYNFKDLLEGIRMKEGKRLFANGPKYRLFFSRLRRRAHRFSQRQEGTGEQVEAGFYTCATLSLEGYNYFSALVPGLLLAWPWMTRTFQAAEASFLLGKSIDDIGELCEQLIGDSEFDDENLDIQTQMLLGTRLRTSRGDIGHVVCLCGGLYFR